MREKRQGCKEKDCIHQAIFQTQEDDDTILPGKAKITETTEVFSNII